MAAENVAAFGTFSIAEEWLRKAVELNPASPETRSFLGATLYRMALYPEARKCSKARSRSTKTRSMPG